MGPLQYVVITLHTSGKKFVMFALGDTNRIPPFRLSSYDDRCAKFDVETLANRRKAANFMMAYDLHNKLIKDSSIYSAHLEITRNHFPISTGDCSHDQWNNSYG